MRTNECQILVPDACSPYCLVACAEDAVSTITLPHRIMPVCERHQGFTKTVDDPDGDADLQRMKERWANGDHRDS